MSGLTTMVESMLAVILLIRTLVMQSLWWGMAPLMMERTTGSSRTPGARTGGRGDTSDSRKVLECATLVKQLLWYLVIR